MNIALATHHAQNYQTLADITFANKQAYAQRWGYAAYDDVIERHYPSIGFEKITFVEKILHNHDYVWWTGCDSLITNFNINISKVIEFAAGAHFIIATDVNGINADSFIVKNSAEGHVFLNLISSFEPQYKHHHWMEQQVIIDLYPQMTNIVKLVPQRLINSYDYKLYPQHPDPSDKLGTNGQWEYGDLLIHWPGLGLQKRLELAQYYLTQVKQ